MNLFYIDNEWDKSGDARDVEHASRYFGKRVGLILKVVL